MSAATDQPKVPKTFRLRPSQDAEITERARLVGLDRTGVVEAAIDEHLKRKPRTVYLPGWIADRTGLDRRQVRAKMAKGHVYILGGPWRDHSISVRDLQAGPVVMDGVEVR